jgi:hypothetical protein
MKQFSATTSSDNGWFKTMRSPDLFELLKSNHCAFILATVIAFRARYHEGFNKYHLGLGEAMLGDYKNYGMTHRQYRTAKQQLSEWGFATFRSTSRGTIGRLMDSRLFSTSKIQNDKQNDERPTNERQTTDKRPTTNKEGKESKNEKKGEDSPRVSWKEVKDLDRIERMIVSERARQCPNRKLLESLVGERKKLIKSMEAYGPSAVLESAPLAVVPKEIPFKDTPTSQVKDWKGEVLDAIG